MKIVVMTVCNVCECEQHQYFLLTSFYRMAFSLVDLKSIRNFLNFSTNKFSSSKFVQTDEKLACFRVIQKEIS